MVTKVEKPRVAVTEDSKLLVLSRGRPCTGGVIRSAANCLTGTRVFTLS